MNIIAEISHKDYYKERLAEIKNYLKELPIYTFCDFESPWGREYCRKINNMYEYEKTIDLIEQIEENFIPKNKLKDMLQEIRKKIVITVGDKLNAEEQGNEKEIKAYSNALDVYNAKADLIEHILAEAKNEKD